MSDLGGQPESSGAGYNENITSEFLDRLLRSIGASGFGSFLGNRGPLIEKVGIIGLQVSAIVGLVAAITLGVRVEEIPLDRAIFGGIAWVVVVILLSYGAYKFLPTLRSRIASAPSTVSSTSLFDVLALVVGLLGVAALVRGLYLGFGTGNVEAAVRDIVGFLFAMLAMGICLNPGSLNIRTAPGGSAADEAIGILSFFLKGMLALIPAVFAVAIILNVLTILGIMFTDFSSMSELMEVARDARRLALMALLPFMGYVFFLIYYFMLDVITAILAIPRIAGRQ